MILDQFYKAIMDRLMSEVTELRHFDAWNNQYENRNPEDGFDYDHPAAFIEFAPIDWIQLGNNTQHATVQFLIHVADIDYTEIDSAVPGAKQAINLTKYTYLINKVYKALQGFNGNLVSPALPFSSICRTGSNMDHNHDEFIIHAIPFRSLLTDNEASLPTAKPGPDLELNVYRDDDLDQDT